MTQANTHNPPSSQQTRPPTLFDHILALRQEVHALRTEVSELKNASAVNTDLIASQTKATNTNTGIIEHLVEGISQIYQMLKQPADQIAPTSKPTDPSPASRTEYPYQTFGDRFKDEDSDF